MGINYTARANEWNERALNEHDPFLKFVLLFITFEVLLGVKGFRKIWDLKKERSLLGCIDQSSLKELIAALRLRPLQNEDVAGNHDWDGMIKNELDWEGILSFLARARNNLFHGDKGLDNERDEFVVSWGNEVLAPIVKELLKR